MATFENPNRDVRLPFDKTDEWESRQDANRQAPIAKAAKLPRPLGARVLVEELVTSLSIRERGKRSGLLVITSEDDDLKNNCTLGTIVALGTDPFLTSEGLAVGKVVSYNRHAGQHRFVEGKRYRMLEFQMIEDVSDERPSDARPLSEVDTEEL